MLKTPIAKELQTATCETRGQLVCILCQTVVRSENVWNVHINTKQHRDKVDEAKKLKERTNNFTTPLKRINVSPTEVPTKKLKGILKNSNTITPLDVNNIENETVNNSDEVVDDTKTNDNEEDMETDSKNDNTVLPEGFFDDPKQDAKVRQIDYKDPIAEEWEKFKKVMRDADNESANIIAEDHEEATNERQLDEIDEQMKNWSKVLTLEKKKTEIISSQNKEMFNLNESDSNDDEENFEEYLDWRTKKFFISFVPPKQLARPRPIVQDEANIVNVFGYFTAYPTNLLRDAEIA
ncbi:hypothetical protein FQA39_LY16677 [Lamprigera yunnana]|nr:hypothetical protein FQA39_LY16677 [Lamprigera yunnana]